MSGEGEEDEVPGDAPTAGTTTAPTVAPEPATRQSVNATATEPGPFRHSDAILKLTLAFAALLSGVGIFYYFVIHLPAEDRAKREIAVAAQAAEQAQLAAAVAAQQRRERARKEAYDACQTRADLTYGSDWDRNCASLAQTRKDQFYRCLDSGGSRSNCAELYPNLPQSDCRLPATTAEAINKSRDTSKARCAEESSISAGTEAIAAQLASPASAFD